MVVLKKITYVFDKDDYFVTIPFSININMELYFYGIKKSG